MKIKSISLGGFKGIREKATLPIAPITLFFGANSTGKSTVLQGFLYLYEILINRNCDPEYSSLVGEKIYLGGFNNLVHGKDNKNHITIGATLDLSEDIGTLEGYLSEAEEWLVENYIKELPTIEPKTYSFEFEITWDSFEKKPFIRKFTSTLDKEFTCVIEKKAGSRGAFISEFRTSNQAQLLHQGIEELNILMTEDWQAVPLSGLDHALPNINNRLNLSSAPWKWSDIFQDHPLSMTTYCESLISQSCLAPLKLISTRLTELLYIGPLRIIPDRNFIANIETSNDRWYDGAAAWELFSKADSRLKEDINRWYAAEYGLNTPYEFIAINEGDATLKKHSVLVKNKRSDIYHYLNELGVGVSQVFPFITASLIEQPCIISCEQPELHIHPRWQLVLADLMLEQINSNNEKNFLIETHSEHLMLRLLKRRRQTVESNLDDSRFNCKKSDIQIIFCEQENGRTKLIPITTTDEGEFDATWPNGFFTERRGELF
ncbi:MAG: AAA family ATPase [Flavobacterium sp.]|nr:AAA family ATPase [Flavobacterium sp.]